MFFAEWVSGDRVAIAQWEYGIAPVVASTSIGRRQSSNLTSPGGIAYHKFYRQTQLLFSETLDQTDYGNWYWATDNVANLTYQSGSDVDVRGAFTTSGALADTNDTNFRAINDSYPTFAFAIGLGSVGSTPVKTLFTIGLAQEQAIQFDGTSGNVSEPSLWTDFHSSELDAVSSQFPRRRALLVVLYSIFKSYDFASQDGLEATFLP